MTTLCALDAGAAGPARSWVGSPPQESAQMALINGTAAQALDFDDGIADVGQLHFGGGQ